MNPTRNRIEALTAGPFFVVRVHVAKAVGGLYEAIMLDYFLRWAEYSHDGWVYRTEQQIEDDTFVRRHSQRKVRENLGALGILDEERRGIPHRNYYRINYQALEDLLGSTPNDDPAEMPNNQSLPTDEQSDEIYPTLGRNRPDNKGSKQEIEQKKNIYTREFDDFWAAWPKKGDAKKPSFLAWRNMTTRQRHAALSALPAWVVYYATQENRFIPNATTWLHQERYENDPPPVAPQDYTKIPNLTAPPGKVTRIDWDELLPDGSKRYYRDGNSLIDRTRARP